MLRSFVSLVLLSLMLTVGMPATAHATTIALVDERADMWQDPLGDSTRAPQQRHGDIRRATITHTERFVRVRIKVAELRRVGAGSTFTARLTTNTGVWRQVMLRLTDERWRGDVEVIDRSTRLVACSVAHTVSYTRNVVRLRVPRSCLDHPRWVRAGIISAFAKRDGRVCFDNAHNDGAGVNVWSKRIRRS